MVIKPSRNRHVRIVVCPENNPEHTGQVGTAASYNRMTAALRVYVGMGICQATVVEAVEEDVAEDFDD